MMMLRESEGRLCAHMRQTLVVVTTAAVFSLMSMMYAGATLRRVIDSSMLGVHRHFSAAAGRF